MLPLYFRYIFFVIYFTKSNLMAGSIPVLNLPEKKPIIHSSRNIFAVSHFL